MSISGLVVHARPEKVSAVRAALDRIAGVEVHAATPDGRLVVTVDQPDERQAADTLAGFRNLEGVLSVSLIYNHFDEDPAEKEHANESVEA